MKAIREPWIAPSVYSPELGFLRLWLERDETTLNRSVNWGAISGMALSVLLSASFWTGLALVVGRVWR